MSLQYPLKRGYTCARCALRLQRLRFSTSSRWASNSVAAQSQSTPPPPPPSSGITRLVSRRLIALHGRDATHFLQGLVTANMRPGMSAGVYGAFLTAPGRVLNDVFIYPASHSSQYRKALPKALAEDEDAYLIECDANEASTLVSHLKRFKLRAKVTVSLVEEGEWSVWSAWNGDEPWTPHPSVPSEAEGNGGAAGEGTDEIGCVDARAPGMGRRLVVPGTDMPATDDGAQLPEATLAAYTIRRMLKGVPEGQAEIQRDHALPQESNMDYMGGIDFRKGCYVGQELTIRTHHTGVVRKRMLPCLLYDLGSDATPEKLQYDSNSTVAQQQLPPTFTNIMPHEKRGRSTGKWVGGVGNIGLGLVRIELMTDMVLTGEGSRWSSDDQFKISWSEGGSEESSNEQDVGENKEIGIKAFVPDWIRSRTKIKNPNPKV